MTRFRWTMCPCSFIVRAWARLILVAALSLMALVVAASALRAASGAVGAIALTVPSGCCAWMTVARPAVVWIGAQGYAADSRSGCMTCA